MDKHDLHQQIGGISTDVRYIRENIEKNRVSLADAHKKINSLIGFRNYALGVSAAIALFLKPIMIKISAILTNLI